ncbi:hypothetical protein GCM10022265_20690 [Marinobacter xestospongiae]|nr:CDP-archaeol synthase [Marinobacter xestospongiae]
MVLSLHLFVLLVLANGLPVVAHWLLGRRWRWPVDGGRCWRDGRRVLGDSKTWRGLVAGCLGAGLYGAFWGLGLGFSLTFGALALVGDLISSFIKRRLGLASSARALGLDQVPEALLPLLLAMAWLGIAGLEVLVLVAAFVAANVLCSPWLYRLGIRRHPH